MMNDIQKNDIPKTNIPEGYVQLLTLTSIFELDIVAKNLEMYGINILCFSPDGFEQSDEMPSLYVQKEQKEQALNILNSLDLLDFTFYGK